MRYDLEDLCDDIASLLKAKLNSKLAAIDADKNDGISLSTLADEAFFFQEIADTPVIYDPFVLYGIESMGTIAEYGVSAHEPTISVIICVSDQGQYSDMPQRMLRYSRALQEIFEENYCLISNSVKLKIQNLMPVQFNLLNSSKTYRAIGINLIASFW